MERARRRRVSFFQPYRMKGTCQTWVANFAWSGLKFFVRSGSRILREFGGKRRVPIAPFGMGFVR
jgi:hypothetical protein